MFDNYQWIEIPGTDTSRKITLFSLSTCGFCRSARSYLESRNLAYRYLELNEIPPKDKIAIKKEFRKKFDKRLHFPSLIIGEDNLLIGFIKLHWEEMLSLQQDR